MRGVDEVVGEGQGHVFTLIQLLGGDDAVLLSAQIPGKAFHRDLTCTNTTQRTDMSVKMRRLKVESDTILWVLYHQQIQ